MKYEFRDKKNKKSSVAPLGAQKNEKNGLGQKAGFASVQRFAEKGPALGTRLLEERSELALKRVGRGAWEQLGWVKRTIVPRGLRLAANGCNGPLQASLRCKAGTLESVDKVKKFTVS
jgi:hypothetical protein